MGGQRTASSAMWISAKFRLEFKFSLELEGRVEDRAGFHATQTETMIVFLVVMGAFQRLMVNKRLAFTWGHR